MTKVCKKCGEEKDINFFQIHKNKQRGKSYIKSSCKDCVRNWNKDWRTSNIEKVKQHAKSSYEKHKEVRIGYVKKWKSLNTEKIDIYLKKWLANNQENAILIRKDSKKKSMESLSDGYIIGLITNGSYLKATDIKEHPELIEHKRLVIQIKRILKQQKSI